MDIELLPPIAVLSSEDKGPIVIVITYILLTNTVLFCLIKLATTVVLRRGFAWDDAFITAAVILSLPQSIITERSAINGVGRFQDSLSGDELQTYFRRAYASNILSVIVQALAKLSAVSLIQRLNATSASKKTYPVVYVSIIGWLLFSIFALAFQCGVSQPWYYTPTKCAGEGALWYPVLVLNIVTDLAISFVFTPVLWGLRISTKSRVRIASLFAIRLIVCALTVAQLVLLSPALHATDTTRTMMKPAVLGQFVMNFSILTAAAPSLNRFMNELTSGTGFGGLMDRTQYEMGSWSSRKRSEQKRNPSGYIRSKDKPERPSFRPDVDNKSYDVAVNEGRKHSTSSGHGSEDMIIKQTTAWAVTNVDRNVAGDKSRTVAAQA